MRDKAGPERRQQPVMLIMLAFTAFEVFVMEAYLK